MRPLSISLLLALSLTASAGDWGQFDSEFEEAKPWNEIEAQLPGPPKPENLLRIDVGPATRHQYFVDTTSVSSSSDGVVRYSLVVKSTGGAQTVNFEGMRCESGEWKLYAFGRPDGTWVRNKYARWSIIKDRETAGYHRELYYHYFCTVDGVGDMKVIEKAFRQGGVRRGENPSF